MIETNKKQKFNIKDFLIFFIIAYTIAPIVSRFVSSYLTTYVYMAIIVVTIIALLSNRGISYFSECIKMLMPFIVWKILVYFLNGSNLVLWGYQSLLDIVPILIGYYFINSYDEKKNNIISLVAVMFFVITILTTIIGCIENPNAARYIATIANPNEAQAIEYDWQNIAGYPFVYYVILLHPLLILAYKKGKIKLWVSLLGTILILALALYTEYTIAFLLTIITSALYFFKKDLKLHNLVIFGIIALFVLVVFSDVISDILLWLADVVESDSISDRLVALAGGRKGVESSDDNRIALYETSFNTFLKYPLVGSFMFGGGGTGGHSFILDFMAQYGLFGLAVLIVIYRIIYKVFIKPYKNKMGFGYIIWTLMQVLIVSTINTEMWLPILTIFIPLFLKSIYSGEKNENIVDSK